MTDASHNTLGESNAPRLVVGTAGHIDHGKSRLVMSLTGVDPDRLPEEKARGMTIELGFAHAAIDGCNIYFVDVPGHERFIRNMVAGATGVDLALLIVSADDSVMPQTREHAEVLSLLGVQRCVVVITKMDLVDDEWADQVAEEMGELLERLGLTAVATVRTSAETGRGLDELRRVLSAQAGETSARQPVASWFRMPIDRAFAIKGRGTVVTGTVAHGALARGAELELLCVGEHKGLSAQERPAARRAPAEQHARELTRKIRVRELQSHDDFQESAAGRMRLAVNLAAVDLNQVRRGFELATPGYLTPASLLDAYLATLRPPGKVRRKKIRVRLHMATSEVLAEVRLLKTPPAAGPARGFAQIRTEVPVVAAWGQRFIIRDESGMRTLGGGRVLRCLSTPWTARRPANAETLQVLLEGEPAQRAEEIIRGREWSGGTAAQLAAWAGLRDEREASKLLAKLTGKRAVVRIQSGTTELYVHADLIERVKSVVTRRLSQFVQDNPRAAGVSRGEWPQWMPKACPERLRTALAERLVSDGTVAMADGFIVPCGHQSAMSPGDQRLYDALLAEFHAAAFQPPAIGDLKCARGQNHKRVNDLIKLAAARGKLVSLGGGLWLHGERYRELTERITQAIREKGSVTVADVRTVLNSSRKYIVPIMEHLDDVGVTKRVGDARVLGA